MNKKLSLLIAGLTLLAGLTSYADNSCQYQVVLGNNQSTGHMRVSLQLKSPEDVSFGTVKTISDSSQMGYYTSCEQMLQYLSGNEGQFLTRGCLRIKYECNDEAIGKAMQSYYKNN